MRKILLIAILAVILVQSLVSAYSAEDLALENRLRLQFDHVIFITNITTNPSYIAPGDSFTLKFTITNEGSQFVRDVITKVNFPAEITTLNDVATVKIPQLDSGESADIALNLIAKPNIAEEIYNLPINIEYVNYIGSDRSENETVGIIISSKPEPLVELKSSEIYKGNEIGKVTISVINNNLANMKFLTVKLLPSDSYKIVSSDVVYVGDLDSDDSQGVDFRLAVKDDAEKVSLPLVLTYKDSVNRDYTIEKSVNLPMMTAEELGIKKDYTSYWVVGIILVVLAFFYFYKRHKDNDMKNLLKSRLGSK